MNAGLPEPVPDEPTEHMSATCSTGRHHVCPQGLADREVDCDCPCHKVQT